MPDKYKAVWVSYSSISDYLKCPRAYYLKNIYKNPESGKKIEIVNPALALGSSIHAVIEPLSSIEPLTRFSGDLIKTFDSELSKYKGEKGGFHDDEEYELLKQKGHKMLNNLVKNKHILEKPTYLQNDELLHEWLSKENEIIICGKIDWVNIDPVTNELSVIDFKTSKKEEQNELQLQIYAVLLYILKKETKNNFNYWYLDLFEELTPANLPDLKDSIKNILNIALTIKDARKHNSFTCHRNGCFSCADYEEVVNGNAKMIGLGNYNREVYIVE